MAVNPSICLQHTPKQVALDFIFQSESQETFDDYLDQRVWNRIFPQYSFTQLICQTDSNLVWLGCQKSNLRRLALKIAQKNEKGSSVALHQQRQKAFVTENQFKNMVKILQIKETKSYRLVVMQYYPWSLADLLMYYTKNSNRKYTQSHLNFIVFAMTGILKAVTELHQLGFVHRDLKLDNFMLDQNLNVYLNDFELVTKQLVIDGSLSGTLQYMAPQRLSQKRKIEPITKGVDLWSLGIILYELFTGQTPFNGQGPQEILDEIYQSYLNPKQIPQEILILIRQLLQIRSQKRLEIEELNKASFLKKKVDMDLIRGILPHLQS